jgi:hypothetical protein
VLIAESELKHLAVFLLADVSFGGSIPKAMLGLAISVRAKMRSDGLWVSA